MTPPVLLAVLVRPLERPGEGDGCRLRAGRVVSR
jgi:hypothetical protein